MTYTSNNYNIGDTLTVLVCLNHNDGQCVFHIRYVRVTLAIGVWCRLKLTYLFDITPGVLCWDATQGKSMYYCASLAGAASPDTRRWLYIGPASETLVQRTTSVLW